MLESGLQKSLDCLFYSVLGRWIVGKPQRKDIPDPTKKRDIAVEWEREGHGQK